MTPVKHDPAREPSLLGRIIDLLLARGGPQDLPWSPALLWRLLWLALAVDWLATVLIEAADDSLPRFALSFACDVLLPWLLLALMSRQARYVQTLSALLATGIVLALVFLPLALAAVAAGMSEAGNEGTVGQGLLALAILATVAWKIWITGNIWHHALEWPFVAGIGVALALFVLELGLDRLVFGVPAA